MSDAAVRPGDPGSARGGAGEVAPALYVTGRFLLGIYLVVPLVLALALLDRWWLGGALRMPPIREPNVFFVAWILMGTPHIVASGLILARHDEYRRRYGLLVLLSLGVILVGLALAQRLEGDAAFAILGLFTAIHVLRQQLGIGRMLGRPEGPWYGLFGGTVVVLGVVFYEVAYLRESMPPGLVAGAEGTVLALLPLMLLLAVLSHRTMATPLGRRYLWANAALVGVSVGVYLAGDVFLALMASRVVHDVTAFAFYVAHDANRSAEPASAVFPALAPRPVWVTCLRLPLLCLGLTLCLEVVGDRWLTPLLGYRGRYGLGLQVAIVLTLLHYVTEAVTWRRGSPYRRYVPVRA